VLSDPDTNELKTLTISDPALPSIPFTSDLSLTVTQLSSDPASIIVVFVPNILIVSISSPTLTSPVKAFVSHTQSMSSPVEIDPVVAVSMVTESSPLPRSIVDSIDTPEARIQSSPDPPVIGPVVAPDTALTQLSPEPKIISWTLDNALSSIQSP